MLFLTKYLCTYFRGKHDKKHMNVTQQQ